MAIAIAVAAIAGCGGSDNGETGTHHASVTSPPPTQTTDPSKESYRDPMDRVHPDAVQHRAHRAFAPRYGGAWIDRSVDPPVLRIAVKDATPADRRELVRLSHGDPQVKLVSVRYTTHRLSRAQHTVEDVLSDAHEQFVSIGPRLEEQDVLLRTPKRLPAALRARVLRRAGTPVQFAIRPPSVTPASTKPEAWTVQQFTLPTQPGPPRAIHLTPSSRTIPVSVESGYCVRGGKPSISKLDVVEASDAVTITAYVHTPRTKVNGICAGVGIELTRRAHLAVPLGHRALLDGSTTPPTPVNPRMH